MDLLIRTSSEQRISNFLLWQNSLRGIVLHRNIVARLQKNHLFEAIVRLPKQRTKIWKNKRTTIINYLTISQQRLKLLFFVVLRFVGFENFRPKKELDSGIKYTINSIKVSGTQTFNENTVIAFTGLNRRRSNLYSRWKAEQRYQNFGNKTSSTTLRLCNEHRWK